MNADGTDHREKCAYLSKDSRRKFVDSNHELAVQRFLSTRPPKAKRPAARGPNRPQGYR